MPVSVCVRRKQRTTKARIGMTYGFGLGLESTVVLVLGRTTEGGGRRGTECDKKRKKESDGKLHDTSSSLLDLLLLFRLTRVWNCENKKRMACFVQISSKRYVCKEIGGSDLFRLYWSLQKES